MASSPKIQVFVPEWMKNSIVEIVEKTGQSQSDYLKDLIKEDLKKKKMGIYSAKLAR